MIHHDRSWIDQSINQSIHRSVDRSFKPVPAECAKRLNPPPAPPLGGGAAACQIHGIRCLHPHASYRIYLSAYIIRIISCVDRRPLLFPPQEPRAFRQALQKIPASASSWRSKFNEKLTTSWEPKKCPTWAQLGPQDGAQVGQKSSKNRCKNRSKF